MKKILPIISIFFLLVSLFFIFKMQKNSAVLALENRLISHYTSTNFIIKEDNNFNYKKMEEATNHRPDDSFLTSSIEQIIKITKTTKLTLEDLFNKNKTPNEQINLTIHNYKKRTHSLLDSLEKSNAIITKEDINYLKAAMFCDSLTSSSSLTALQKNVILNHINVNSMQLIRFFSSRIGCGTLVFDRFQPRASLHSVTPNSQTFKIFLSHPKAFSITDLEVYYNNSPFPIVDSERVIQIPVQDNTVQTAVLSASWTNPNYPKANIPNNNSISDTFTLTPFN